MRFATTLGRKLVSFAVRGAALGAGLGAAFPMDDVSAACDCHDYGSGTYGCSSGNAASCSAGTEDCDVTCSS